MLHPELIAICGGNVKAALMLAWAIYLTDLTSDTSGWFYKTRDEWLEEIGLDRAEQEGARARLQNLGFLKEKRRGIPAKMYFCLDSEAVCNALRQLARNPPTSRQKTCQQAGRNSANLCAQDQPTFKEAETTQRVPEKKHHAASGALNDWLTCKNQLRTKLSDAEWKLWVRPALLLRLLSDRTLLIALPPNRKIMTAAKARQPELNQAVIALGYSGLGFTRYPDEDDRERLRGEYPNFYEQMFGNRKRESHKARGQADLKRYSPKGDACQ
jgi:hypothetical protein